MIALVFAKHLDGTRYQRIVRDAVRWDSNVGDEIDNIIPGNNNVEHMTKFVCTDLDMLR